jgi:hypothetical protein
MIPRGATAWSDAERKVKTKSTRARARLSGLFHLRDLIFKPVDLGAAL